MNVCSYQSLNSFDLKGINDRFSSVYKQVCYLTSITGSGSTGAGTVTSGTANRLTYYAAGGTIVSPLAAISASRALVSDVNGLPVASSVTSTEVGYVSGVTSAIQTQLNTKAPLASPTFTGVPLSTTPAPGDNSTKISTTAFVKDAIDTGKKLSSLLGADSYNNILNGNNQQQWTWDTLGANIGLNIQGGTTGTANNGQVLMSLASTGTSGGSSQSTTTLRVFNTQTGTNKTNIGFVASATGGTFNYAIIVPSAEGFTGLGTSTPTAILHLGAGSTTTAQLKFNSGSLLTTPQTGAIEFDGTHFYGSIGSTRYQLDQQSAGGGTWGSITGTLSSQTDLNTALGLKAPLASPTFTGTPLITTTPSTGDNSHKIADTAFVQQEFAANTIYFGPEFSGDGSSGDPITQDPMYFDDKFSGTGTLVDPFTLSEISHYNNQTGTTYTLQASDIGKVVTLSNGSAITLTVPTSLPTGFNCSIVQLGVGQVTITPSSTTIHNRQSFTKTAGQYSAATILQYATNTFLTQGDMA